MKHRKGGDREVVRGSSLLKPFEKEMRKIVYDALEAGWTGQMSTRGHVILRAPDGKTTMCVPRSALRGRSGANTRAELDRWKRKESR